MRTLFTFLLVCTLATTGFSQKFLLGAKGGLQYYTVDFADDSSEMLMDDQYKLGYKIGASIIFPLAENFHFGTEGFYSVKGRKYAFDSPTYPSFEDAPINNATYQFIELSAFLRKSYRMALGEGKYPGHFFFNVGPNVMHWIGGNGKIQDVSTVEYEIVFSEPQDGDFRKNYITDFNKWLFGLDFGAGFSFLTKSNETVAVEFRYTYGHTYLGGENASFLSILGFNDDLRSRYRVLNVSIAYLFDVDLRKTRKGKSTIKRKQRR